ncbi:MAG: hypothetical protein B6244_08800 [Candidatus Cloacimonetes bacterium 4572_55]|nr:MAG: hypothetical protein B6244_08800 [Candidatus Cloacimonetes bacterium 4572_55]
MFQNANLRNRILLPISSAVIITFITIFTVVSIRATNMAREAAYQEVEQSAFRFANQIDAELEVAMHAARTLAQALEGLKNSDMSMSRDRCHEMIKNVLINNENFIGMCTAWEPNAFDGRDAQFVNALGHDETGRFIPYWSVLNDELRLNPLVDYDNPQLSRWYFQPKLSGLEAIVEPYLYPIAGEDVLMTTVSGVIKNQDNFVGVTTVDIALSNLNDIAKEFRLFNSGYAFVISYDGSVVTHPDSRLIGQDITALPEQSIISRSQKQAREGEVVRIEGISDVTGEKVYAVTIPIQVGYSETPWGLVVIAPISEILDPVKKILSFVAGISFLALFFLIALIISLSNNIAKPIKDAAEVAKQISEGDLAVKVTEKVGEDEAGQLLTAIQKMTDSLRVVIRQVMESIILIAETTDRLSDSSRQIQHGTIEQSSATEETFASMEEMASSIQHVAGNTEALANNVGETSASIEQMTKSIQSVATNTNDLTDIVNRNTAIIENMVVSIEHVAHNASTAGVSSRSAVEVAQNGGDIVKLMVRGMQQIAGTMGDIIRMIGELKESSKRINSIVEVIDDIADQTNLLALNAAIEAARAGEHGRGFAVVAEEVRKLAERSAGSAKKIVELIQNVQTDTENTIHATEEGARQVNEGVASAGRAGEALEKIVEEIESVNKMMEEISHTTDQQASASDQVVKGFEDIRRMTRQINNATKEQSRGGDQIMKAVDMMNTMTKQVSMAMNEQNRSGEQVVKAVENIASISQQNQDLVTNIVSVIDNLNRQAEELRQLSSSFRTEPKHEPDPETPPKPALSRPRKDSPLSPPRSGISLGI